MLLFNMCTVTLIFNVYIVFVINCRAIQILIIDVQSHLYILSPILQTTCVMWGRRDTGAYILVHYILTLLDTFK